VYQIVGSDVYYYCATSQYSTVIISRINWDGDTFTVTAGKENHPMGMVTWYGAAAYCNWLSQKDNLQTCYDSSWNCDIEKRGYRLPTEAEWEYAGRGGVAGCKYPFCNDCNNIDGSKANYWGSGDPYEGASAYPYTAAIGFYNGQLHNKSDFGWAGSQTTYQTSDGSNCYGLYDMAGNVWEWCNDWYSATYYEDCKNAYPILPYPNPEGPASSDWKVVRGGGWRNNDFRATAASRSNLGAVMCENDNLGFRVVLRME
jgi:formylglycine-generating enzyme required for sulfatase activity